MKHKIFNLILNVGVFNILFIFSAMAQSVIVNISSDTVFQTMQGFGSSQRLFKDPHIIGGSDNDQDSTNGLNITLSEQNVILDKLYTELGLTRMRLAIYPMRIEPVNDNGNPNETDLSKFNFAWKMNDGFLDYVYRAKPRGLITWWHSPVNLESWMNETNPDEYVEWAMAIIRRWRDKGLEFPYWSIMNEPSYIRSGIWSGEYLREAVKLLGAKLKSEGFKTKIVIPDDVRSTDGEAKAKVVLADTLARKYVSALAIHLYDEAVTNVSKMKKLADQYSLPLWMSEYSDSDAFSWVNLMHDLIATYNVSAVDCLFAFGKGGYIDFNNNGTQYLGYVLSKKYFYVGQYSRFVRPGFQRISATSNNLNIKVTAYKSDSAIVIVAINNSHNSLTTDFNFRGGKTTSQINAVRSSATENWAILSPFNMSNSTFSTILPSNSVTTFTTKINLVASSKEDEKNSMLHIYPNPAQQTFMVEMADEKFDLLITNLTGKTMYEKKNISKKIQIESKNFIAGVYFVKATSGIVILKEKIIITK